MSKLLSIGNAKKNILIYPKGIFVRRGRIKLEKNASAPLNEHESFLNDLQALRPDLDIDFIKNILLNQRLYLEMFPDVKASLLCPVFHYFTYGNKERREFCTPNFRAIKKISDQTGTQKIIFFDTLKSNASFLYRGFFPEIRNEDTQIIHQETELITAIKSIFSASEMVFIRPSINSKRTKYFMELCKILNIKTSINFDDLLIPEYILEKGAVRSRVANIVPMKDHLIRDSAMLLGAEKLILSTKMLSDKFAGFVNEIVIEKNRLPIEYFKKRDSLVKKLYRDNDNRKFNLLYLSGSRTHLKDYSIISGPLIKLAMKYPEKFIINFMGTLSDQTAIFSNLGVETKLIPFVSFEEMLDEISRNDVVLVPLEKTVFNDAKSNIKFIEAASQGITVIASPVDEYCSIIESGINGLLCKDEYEWYVTLESIILEKINVKKLGLAAYDSALKGCSV